MRIYPLFSSSSGNCTYIGDKTCGIMIDCGVSCKRICGALNENEIPLSAVKAIFITHEHSDHVAGLKALTKKLNVTVYARQGTIDHLYGREMLNSDSRGLTDSIEIEGFKVTAFDTMHDAMAPCCYRIEKDGAVCGVCTDLGMVTDTVREGMKGVSAVLLESNYDADMLSHGPYSKELKERISSPGGHLENSRSAEFSAFLVKNGTKKIILGHLSRNNNTPEKASAEHIDTLARNGFVVNRDYMLMTAEPEGNNYISF